MKPSRRPKLLQTSDMRSPTELEEKRGEVVMNMVVDIMEKSRSSLHIARSMIHISLIVRSLDVKAMSTGRHSLQRKMVATYALGHRAKQSSMN